MRRKGGLAGRLVYREEKKKKPIRRQGIEKKSQLHGREKKGGT